MNRAVVYVAHKLSAPSREGMLSNGRLASWWCAWLCENFNVATVADWIVMSSVLLETPENRALGLECDKALIERCDAILLVGRLISAGMELERSWALTFGKVVIDLTSFGIVMPTEKHLEPVAEVLAFHGITRKKAA